MQQSQLLHNILEKSCAIKHKTRLKSLVNAVESLTVGGELSVNSLGRYMKKEIKVKHKIKEIDYLVNNGHTHNERLNIYKAMNEWIIGQEKLLFIAIDWSSIVAHEQHLLRASIIRKGRSVTVYDEIHEERLLGNKEVHLNFLEKLKLVLPKDCEICIIVDAGFKTDFFLQVETMDWDYVARILSNMHYTLVGQDDWKPTSELDLVANSTPETIGAVQLAKSNKIASNLYLYKKLVEEKTTDEKTKVRKIKYGKNEKNHSNAGRRPWLIASSLDVSPKKIMAIYRARMKIEHDFRDTKDPKWGLGLRISGTTNPMTLSILILIGVLACFILWLIGLCLEEKCLHRDFQANTIRHKRVLSLIYLAIEGIREGYLKYISEADFEELRKKGLHDQLSYCTNFVGNT